MTTFVTMYHPALNNVRVQAPLEAEALYEAHGWVLDGGGAPPPADIYLTPALGDLRYAPLGPYVSSSGLPVATVGSRYRNITILTYHAVPSLSAFQTDLDYYQQWNYTTVGMDDVSNHLDGISTLPAKPLLITFDDGYATQYTAAQELNSRGMKGVFFIATDWIDGTLPQAEPGFTEATALTWTQLNQIHAWGHDIQSHTMHHQDQQSLTVAQVKAQYTGSKARLEAQIPGITVNHLAYPYGSWNPTVRQALIDVGCKTARIVRCAADGTYPGPNLGRLAIATTLHDRYQLPTSGTSWGDIIQPNFNCSLAVDPELIPDYGFEAGGKGWTLGTGFTVDAADKHSGTKSMVAAQQTSSASSRTTLMIPVGPWCRVVGSVWIKTAGLPTGTLTKVQQTIWKPDGATQYQTQDLVTVTGNNGSWTQYSWNYIGDMNSGFLWIIAFLQGSSAAGAGSPSGSARFDDLTLKRELVGPPTPLPY